VYSVREDITKLEDIVILVILGENVSYVKEDIQKLE
jgi:hypothetical protein